MNQTPRQTRFLVLSWAKDARNPIFVPHSQFDAKGAQAPFVIKHDDQWWMFYAGIGTDSIQRICLATALPQRPTEWTCLGPILELGPRDAFDELSATYPRVHRFAGKWHLYYSGRSRRQNEYHFANYWGIGLAQSDDLIHWKKFSKDPVLQADCISQYPDCQALVGLGNIIEVPDTEAKPLYRMYYTLLPGLKDPNWQANGTWHVIEHKVCVAAESSDGLDWKTRRLVFDRRRDVTTEDIGVVGLNVWKTGNRYHAVYTGLGTKFKTYSLCEAISSNGLIWERGRSSDNVSLTIEPGQFESAMVAYPCILIESDGVRLFYNGAGGGSTGVGMAFVPNSN